MKTFRILLGNWNMYIYTDKKKRVKFTCLYLFYQENDF